MSVYLKEEVFHRNSKRHFESSLEQKLIAFWAFSKTHDNIIQNKVKSLSKQDKHYRRCNGFFLFSVESKPDFSFCIDMCNTCCKLTFLISYAFCIINVLKLFCTNLLHSWSLISSMEISALSSVIRIFLHESHS